MRLHVLWPRYLHAWVCNIHSPPPGTNAQGLANPSTGVDPNHPQAVTIAEELISSHHKAVGEGLAGIGVTTRGLLNLYSGFQLQEFLEYLHKTLNVSMGEASLFAGALRTALLLSRPSPRS